MHHPEEHVEEDDHRGLPSARALRHRAHLPVLLHLQQAHLELRRRVLLHHLRVHPREHRALRVEPAEDRPVDVVEDALVDELVHGAEELPEAHLAARVLLAPLEECNPGASNNRAPYEDVGEVLQELGQLAVDAVAQQVVGVEDARQDEARLALHRARQHVEHHLPRRGRYERPLRNRSEPLRSGRHGVGLPRRWCPWWC